MQTPNQFFGGKTMDKNKVHLVIGGLDYYLTTDENVDELKRISAELNEKITDLLKSHTRLSQVQAAVLCALEYADRLNEAENNAEYYKSQIRVYMEDAERAKTEAEMARREAERMTRDLRSIRRSLEEN